MYTPLQSLHIRGSAGDPIPAVFTALEEKGTRFHRGQLALVAAPAGCGKSAFVLTLALRSGLPALYFSADSDAFTQLTRTASIMTGWTLERSARLVRADDLAEAEGALAALPIRFNYSASPTLDQIESSMSAYRQLYGDYPELVVIDNITNVLTGEDDPFSGLEALLDYLHTLARNTGACVIGLHHVIGEYNDGDKPIPVSGVKGQISRVPELILTMHRKRSEFGPDLLMVSTVKNRGGRADPSGQDAATLEFIGDSMTIRDAA